MFTEKLHQIILCANAKQLVAGIWHADQLQQSERFLNNAEGHAAFKRFITQQANIKIFLISNALEEDYRVESLPHTTGSAKKQLLNRKLDQFYRGLTYRAAHFIMREKDKRKDDRYLFVALNNDDFLQEWMQIIQETQSQLVGVYVLPMLSRFLVKQYNISAPHILLCEMLSSGLRQTYLHNGRLRMSRLIPNVPTDSKQLSYFYSVETQKTRLYLMSKRLIARDTVLNVQLASVDTNHFDSVKDSFAHETDFEFESMPLSQFIKSQQLSYQAVKKIPELLHMQLLATGIKVDNLAPESHTAYYRIGRVSTFIKAIALILAISAVIISAWYFYQGFALRSDIQTAKQATQLERLKYKNVAAGFPETKINANDLQKAVKLDETFAALPHSPRPFMLVVSKALKQSPSIQLHHLNWQQRTLATLKAEYPQQRFIKQLPKTTSLMTAGLIEADIRDFTGNYRQANAQVNQFAQALKQDPAVAGASVIQLASNQQSYADLSGSTQEAQKNTAMSQATFKVLVVLSAPNGKGGKP